MSSTPLPARLADSVMDPAGHPSLPSGVVTFLLTDVEGSTRLWESAPATAAASISRHYELLGAAVDLHGGHRPVEQGEGDSVVAAFARASDALAAALDVQRAFEEEPWPQEQPVRVRLAVHTGETQFRDAGNYFGPAIIRCARLRSIANGGQIVVSDATRDLVVDALPDGAALRDLGSHRLKDLGRAERVWQLVHPDLAQAFPPLRSLDAFPTNLPFQLSHFVGREPDLADLVTALGRHRLVTLTGAGGCGKTRLALQAAAERVEHHRDGVWSVELGSLNQGEEIAYAVARVFNLREEHGRPLVDTLIEQLHDHDALLLLDNCEQVLEGAARLVETLLHAIPRLRVLATSREPLGVEGEVAWRVKSLGEEDGGALFVDRAQQARPGFEPDDADRAVIGQIVERLDGIPLAIELAAARTRMMHPARILEGLHDRFRLLTGGTRTVMARQQTLEASVAWSYDLLDEAERTLARRLSVLHGFTLETAEAVGSDAAVDRYAVLDLLTHLLDKSLVHVVHESGDTRYRMLETVRQFLHVRLLDSGETDAVRTRHLAHFLDVAERLAPHLALRDGPIHLAHLEADFDNLEDALEWAASSAPHEQFLRLATALTLFWELRGHLGPGGRWFARALDGDGSPAPSSARARALWGAAHVAFYGSDWETAPRRAAEALAMAEAFGDPWATARALNTVGGLQVLEVPAEARKSLERSIEFGRAIGDSWAVADGWKMMTVGWYVGHDELGARPALEELHRVAGELGSRFFLAWYHVMVGYFARDRGDYVLARASFEESLRCCHDVGDPSTGGFAEVWLGALEADEGDFEGASQRLESLLTRATATGSDLAAPEGAYALGRLALGLGDPATARAVAEPVVETLRLAGVPMWTAQALVVVAASHRVAGDLGHASAALEEAATLARPIESTFLDALIDHERALLARAAGDGPAAEELLLSVLQRQVAAGLRPGAAQTLESLCACALDAESPVESTRCLAVATALRAAIGYVATPVEGAAVDACRQQCRAILGDDEFESTSAAAAAVPLTEIVEWLWRARGTRRRPSSGWSSLTPTELRIVALVAEGLTNPQIAERMFISRGTAKVHVSHIFSKLGVTSRAQLAAEATART